MTDSGFADRLALAIRNKRLTQAGLASAMEVSPSTVSRWLAGSVPRKLVLAAIADFLKVDVDWLREGKGQAGMLSALSLPDWSLVPSDYLEHPDTFTDGQAAEIINRANEKKRLGIGRRVQELRKCIGLRLRAFAAACGMNASYVSRIESGKNSNPSSNMVDKMMAAFPIAHRWLLYGDLPILRPDAALEGWDQSIVRSLREMQQRETVRYREFRNEFIRKLAAANKLGLAAQICSIELRKDGGQTEENRALRDLMVDVLMARIPKDDDFKKSSK